MFRADCLRITLSLPTNIVLLKYVRVVTLCCILQLSGRTLRVDHVAQYRRPKDDRGNEIIETGCGPRTPEASPSPSPPPSPVHSSSSDKEPPQKKDKKHKKRKKHKTHSDPDVKPKRARRDTHEHKHGKLSKSRAHRHD